MKVFVTGATGKVGSRFVPYLIEHGCDVRVLVRNAERAQALKEQCVEIVIGDLLENDDLAGEIQGVDAVVHLAAQFRGVSPEVAQASNIDASIKLAEAALDAGVTRFIFSSTSLVYGGIRRDSPCNEDDVIEPILEYPKTKKVAENALIQMHHEKGLDLRIMRFAFVYGDGDRHIEEFAPIMRTWNPTQKLSLVHHKDICQALLLAAITPDVGGRIYNVADDVPMEVGEIIRLVGLPKQVEPDAGWVGFGPFDMIDNTERIKKELKFCAKYPSFVSARDNQAL